MNNKTECPKCHQFKTYSSKDMAWTGFWTCLFLAIFLVWLPVVNIVLWIMVVVFLVSGIAASMDPMASKRMTCQNCHNRWEEGKDGA